MPSAEALDRLYRPEALDVPVLVPRDGPIAALDPASVGILPAASTASATPSGAAMAAPAPEQVASLAPTSQVYGPMPAPAALMPAPGASLPAASIPAPAGTVAGVEEALAGVLGTTLTAGPDATPLADPNAVLVTTGPAPKVELVAAREAWVRVNGADGSVIFEGILGPGDTFELPATEEPAKLRVGDSGALYMAVNGTAYGPVGGAGEVTSNVALSAEAIAGTYQVADLSSEAALADSVAVASAAQVAPSALPPGAVLPGAQGAAPAEAATPTQ